MIGARRRHTILVWRRFSLILVLLGALALGGTGYASDVGPDAAAPSDMTQMLDHDCCPQGSGIEDVGAAERGQPCNGMDACSGNPCGLACSFSTLIPDSATTRPAPGHIERTTRRVVLRPVSTILDHLDRPPRA